MTAERLLVLENGSAFHLLTNISNSSLHHHHAIYEELDGTTQVSHSPDAGRIPASTASLYRSCRRFTWLSSRSSRSLGSGATPWLSCSSGQTRRFGSFPQTPTSQSSRSPPSSSSSFSSGSGWRWWSAGVISTTSPSFASSAPSSDTSATSSPPGWSAPDCNRPPPLF